MHKYVGRPKKPMNSEHRTRNKELRNDCHSSECWNPCFLRLDPCFGSTSLDSTRDKSLTTLSSTLRERVLRLGLEESACRRAAGMTRQASTPQSGRFLWGHTSSFTKEISHCSDNCHIKDKQIPEDRGAKSQGALSLPNGTKIAYNRE